MRIVQRRDPFLTKTIAIDAIFSQTCSSSIVLLTFCWLCTVVREYPYSLRAPGRFKPHPLRSLVLPCAPTYIRSYSPATRQQGLAIECAALSMVQKDAERAVHAKPREPPAPIPIHPPSKVPVADCPASTAQGAAAIVCADGGSGIELQNRALSYPGYTGGCSRGAGAADGAHTRCCTPRPPGPPHIGLLPATHTGPPLRPIHPQIRRRVGSVAGGFAPAAAAAIAVSCAQQRRKRGPRDSPRRRDEEEQCSAIA